MPTVGGKKFPYTPSGLKAAAAAAAAKIAGKKKPKAKKERSA